MNFEELLSEIGEYGSYQKLVLWFLLVPGVFPCGFHAYNQLFMAFLPEHWCRVPTLSELIPNASEELIKKIRFVLLLLLIVYPFSLKIVITMF